jgi:hypothetical protein
VDSPQFLDIVQQSNQAQRAGISKLDLAEHTDTQEVSAPL